MNRRALLAAGAALGAGGIATALLLAPGEPPPPAGAGGLMFPGLAGRLADATELRIRRHDGAVLLARTPAGWVLPERDGFPIREAKLRELLTGFTELRLMEPRATEAPGWARLGVDDPATAGSTAAELRLLDAQGRAIMEVLVGRRRLRTQGATPESVYARRLGEAQSWLAEGRIPVDTDAASWMDRDIFDVAPERVVRVTLRRVGAEPIVLARAAPGAPLVPPPETQADAAALEDIARGLQNLTLLDALPAARIPGEAVGEARLQLDDGLAISIRTHRHEQFVWITLVADGPGAAPLNTRWSAWAYQVGQWKERAFAPTPGDLAGGR